MKQQIKSTFPCVIKAVALDKRNEAITVTKASLEKLRTILPEIHEDNEDLLPIALDACVVNKFNKNNDGIDSSVAYDMYKNFAFKPINIEHETHKVIGTILSASFMDMDHNEIDPESVVGNDNPFYISLSAVLWRRVNDSLANYIEDCSNPESPNYKEISASWELAFYDYRLVAREDESTEIKGAEELKEMDYTEAVRNNPTKKIYRKIVGKALPIGLGLVENPAANVEGIVTELTKTSGGETNNVSSSNEVLELKLEEALKLIKEADAAFKKSTEELSNKISQLTQNNVTTIKPMKISLSKDITDSLIKEGTITASMIHEFVSEIEKANEDYKSKQSKAQEEVAEIQKKNEDLSSALSNAQQELEKMKLQLQEIQNKVNAEEAQKTFAARMSFFDEKYTLSPEVKKVLAAKIRVLASENDFASFKDEMELFLNSSKKTETSKASENTEQVVDDLLKDKKAAGTVNTIDLNKDKVSEYDKAFAKDQFIINN